MKSNHHALIVGVGDYPPGIHKLPAVAADTREIVKLLGSDSGAFDPNRMELLDDAKATRDKVLTTLRDTLGKAGRDDTVFVYFAGHGSLAPDKSYYFIPYDGNRDDLPATAVPLAEIRKLFEESPCLRLFMFLDFCHSGGILSRDIDGPEADDATQAVARTLDVVQGRGKVILCACTADQRAYENAAHGRFTEKLLAGLQGAAVNHLGEVTVNSLHDYVDAQMGSASQKPMFYGQMEGRIVLMQARAGSPGAGSRAGDSNPAPGGRAVSSSGTFVMIDNEFYRTSFVQQVPGGNIIVKIVSEGAEDDARISALKGDPWRSRGDVAYACRNDGMLVRVKECEQEFAGGNLTWTITLEPNAQQPMGSAASEVAYSEAGKTYSADQLAELRARRLLLDDPPRPPAARGYNQNQDSGMLEVMIQGMNSAHKAAHCVLRGLWPRFHDDPNRFLEVARLAAIFELKATNVFEHVLDLTLGPIVDQKVHVHCRGKRRQPFSNHPATILDFEGDCSLEP